METFFEHTAMHPDPRFYIFPCTKSQKLMRPDAISKGIRTVIGADCNAVVGCRTSEDDIKIIGDYGFGHMNDRGAWLKYWASVERLALAKRHLCLSSLGIRNNAAADSSKNSNSLLQ